MDLSHTNIPTLQRALLNAATGIYFSVSPHMLNQDFEPLSVALTDFYYLKSKDENQGDFFWQKNEFHL